MSNKQVTFHCGLHKTASTFLQEKVFPYMSSGTFVPVSGVGNWFDNMSKARPPVLSSAEIFSGFIFSGNYKESRTRMLSYISSHWPGSQLVLFLREPSDFVTSVYLQYLNIGGTIEFENFLEEFQILEGVNYPELMGELNNMEWGNILYILYEDFVDDPCSQISKIENYVGDRFSYCIENDRVNKSVENLAARTLRLTNKFAPYNGRHGSKTAIKILRNLGLMPRDLLQKNNLFSVLSRIGSPVVDVNVKEEIRVQFSGSWQETRELVKLQKV